MITHIGWCLNQLDRDEEALEYYMKALAGEEDNIWLLSQIGVTLGVIRRYEEGIEYLKKAEELGRNDIWLFSFFYSTWINEKKSK